MTRARESRPLPALPTGTRVAAVVATYHREVTGAMLASARDALREAGLAAGDLLVVEVPGAFELPLLTRHLAGRADVDAVLCFGLVLKGETEHDRHIASAVAHHLAAVAVETVTPILFGVLTCSTLAQAEARARRAADGGLDKGREVAVAAIETLRAMERAHEPFGDVETLP